MNVSVFPTGQQMFLYNVRRKIAKVLKLQIREQGFLQILNSVKKLLENIQSIIGIKQVICNKYDEETFQSLTWDLPKKQSGFF